MQKEAIIPENKNQATQKLPKNFYLLPDMNNPETNQPNRVWKGRLIKFIIYLVVGFLCAFLYRQFKN